MDKKIKKNNFDYIVIGGGMAGLSFSYEMKTKGYSTLILDLTYQGSEVYINTDTNTIEVKGEEVDNYNSFVRALKEEINEGYAQFRNETKTRTKPEQYHSAVKEVKKKVNEINRLFEYMDRLKSELNEGEEIKYKKYTEKAIQQIKEQTKSLFFKSTKLK
jgi:thioredoxin reductase